MLNEENLVATLEQSLRQTRNAQNRLLGRLREVESEAESLRTEIDALANSAEKTEQAIYSILATMGASNNNWKVSKKSSSYEEDDYQLQNENRRHQQQQQQQQQQRPISASPNLQSNNSSNNYRNPVTYINNPRNVTSINQNYEPLNHRFADRTITQACTLLLRDAGEPLHVNELYKLLREGGFEFKGNNPTISIAVSLNRNRRFSKVAPGTFDLVMRDASQVAS